MDFSKSDLRWFEEAHKEATKSNYRNVHLGTVIVYKGHIIGRGHNSTKSAPIQKHFNRYRKFNYTGSKPPLPMLHSEIAAIKSVPYTVDKDTDWSKVKLYTWRIAVGLPGHFGNSSPCPACRELIREKGIRHLYYSGDNSLIYERLF